MSYAPNTVEVEDVQGLPDNGEPLRRVQRCGLRGADELERDDLALRVELGDEAIVIPIGRGTVDVRDEIVAGPGIDDKTDRVGESADLESGGRGGRECERLQVCDQVGEFLRRQAGLEALGHRRRVALGLLFDVRLSHVMRRALAVEQDHPLASIRDDEARENLAVRQRERGGAETVGDLLRGEEDRLDQLGAAVGGGDPGQVGAAFAPRIIHSVTLDATHAPGVVEEGSAAPRVAAVGEGKGGVIIRLQSSTDGREKRGKVTVTCVDGSEFER